MHRLNCTGQLVYMLPNDPHERPELFVKFENPRVLLLFRCILKDKALKRH